MGKKAITFAEARRRGITGYLGWMGPDHPDHPLNRPWAVEGLFQSMKAEAKQKREAASAEANDPPEKDRDEGGAA